MRLPLVSDPKPEASTRHDGPRITPRGRCAVLVPAHEPTALAFASLVLAELARVDVPRSVVVERTSPLAIGLPAGLATHGAPWSRIAADDGALMETIAPGRAVLLVGTGFAATVAASFVVVVHDGHVQPMLSADSRRARAFVDASIAEARPGFAEWLARRLGERHP